MENEEKFPPFLLIYREEDHSVLCPCELSRKLGEIKTANTKNKILTSIGTYH